MTEEKTWLHIGAGSFHRAHQALYLHKLRETGDKTWSITLGNIRDDQTPILNNLAAQNCEYTLETVDPLGQREYTRVTSIKKVVPWDKDLAALSAVGADPATQIISFTVTEAGYYLDTKFKLDQANPDIKADLAGGKTTIYGAIASIMKLRKEKNGGKATLLCCDNVRHNGERFHDGLMQFLELRGENELADWINASSTHPLCMVDRITPRPNADVAARVLANTGFKDKAAIMGESFIQWVIEDNFAAARPDLEKVGVEIVKDVLPYEEAKIRILNASHSCVAWAGTLVGLNYIHEDTQTPSIREMAYNYVTNDVIPCLTPCPLDLNNYRDVVLDRFANPNILDTNQRVAADGYSKIPAMIAPTIRECYAKGMTPAATAMLPALFFVFLRKWHEGSIPYKYEDGVMNPDAAHAMFKAPDALAAFAKDEALFGDLAGRDDFLKLFRDSVLKVDEWMNSMNE